MGDKEKSKKKSDTSDFDRFVREPPFIGAISDWREFIAIADECLQRVQASTNPREMALETWLLVDYCLRELLLAAFNLKRFNHEEFDLRYEFLPRSFTDCIRALRNVLKVHQSLRPPQQVVTVSMSLKFAKFLQDYDNNAFDTLIEAEQAYLKKFYPDLKIDEFFQLISNTRGYVSEDWLKIVRELSDTWFTRAERLNSVRNLAAHTYDQEKILSRFGVTGPKAIDLFRSECLALIRELVGIVPRSEAATSQP